MKVIVATPMSSSVEFPEVHADGCADVARGIRSFKYGAGHAIDVEALEDAARWIWADCIRDGSMTESGALTQIRYMPCVRKAVA